MREEPRRGVPGGLRVAKQVQLHPPGRTVHDRMSPFIGISTFHDSESWQFAIAAATLPSGEPALLITSWPAFKISGLNGLGARLPMAFSHTQAISENIG